MTASVHEAEVFLNAAPIVVDPDDQDVRNTCLPDDDARVEAIGERKRERGRGRELLSFRQWVCFHSLEAYLSVFRERRPRVMTHLNHGSLLVKAVGDHHEPAEFS